MTENYRRENDESKRSDFIPLIGKFDIANAVELDPLPPRGTDPYLDELEDKLDALERQRRISEL